MPRIRSLKPEIFQSPQVMNLTHGARLLFIGLITQADDEGRGTADARRLKAVVFGGDDVTAGQVTDFLAEIEAQHLAQTYDANGHGKVYALPSFTEHQYIQKSRPSVYPAPPKQSVTRLNRTNTGALPYRSRTATEGSDRIGSDRIGSDRKDQDPTLPFPETGQGGTAPRAGKNRRESGSNPRALGTDPRSLGTNPRAQRNRSKAAWREVITAVDGIKGTARTWGEIERTCPDLLVFQVGESIGFKRLADRTKFNTKALESEFRSAYELASARLANIDTPKRPEGHA